ncbi:glycosyltransferase family 2 protein [Aquimarina sp. W85]|uniref:glycosyltransferase family 2 protein n=1 Tax=Aquimarina rhodophyticola TaxID=3342246 RepID=UPI00366CD707
MMYDISVILINYNSSSFTINCIDSIFDQTSSKLAIEIIIVDNASAYEDYQIIKKRVDLLNLQTVTLVRSRINTGFGGGNMLGVQHARGKYYAFINNDTLLQNDCLSIVYDFLEKTSDAAICCPQQYDEHNEVQKSFDHFLSLRRELFGRSILEKLAPKKYPKRKKIYEQPLKVQSVPGSFLVANAEAFDSVGGFDTNIFLYYEETDLCYRLLKKSANGSSYLVPQGRYTHFKGQSTAKSFAIKKELKISLLYVLKKNSGYLPYLILRFWLLFKFLLKSLFSPKNWKLCILFAKGAPLTESLKHRQILLEK